MDTNYQLNEAEHACGFSARFQSIVGAGNVSFIDTASEKVHALKQIMCHNTGKDDWEFSAELLNKTSVFKLEVTELSCKQHE